MIHLFICLCVLITICQEPNDLLIASFILRKLLSFRKYWPAAVHPFTFPSQLHKSLINLSSTLGILWGTQQQLFANHRWSSAHLAKVSRPLPLPKPIAPCWCSSLLPACKDISHQCGALPLLCGGGEEALALLFANQQILVTNQLICFCSQRDFEPVGC